MEHLRKLGLLDGNGQPLDARIEGVLSRLLPRLRREFPALQDEVAQVEVLEEAGRRMVVREGRTGPIEKINGYAWVTIRSIALSRVRQGPGRLLQHTLGAASEAVLSRVAALDGSAEQIEQGILLREVLAPLTRDEQRVFLWKFMGLSSQEIAQRRGTTATAVDMLLFHAKEKIRRVIGVQHSEPKQTAPAGEPQVRAAGPQPLAPLSENPDDETEPS
ncbi:MAG: sigma-70 family RNA polymerase sigma factor [Acidobacteria bacterium]|nr:sigma-70 family RNA polymerase sigma factor [Acidobacteriota bacterium]